MPKISAPTVAQHRVRQRGALLRAATELLVNGGVSAVTPAAVGAAAGLSRPSVYQYFSSGADILAAVVEEAFPPANESLRLALDSAVGPAEKLDTYVRETLRLAAEGASPRAGRPLHGCLAGARGAAVAAHGPVAERHTRVRHGRDRTRRAPGRGHRPDNGTGTRRGRGGYHQTRFAGGSRISSRASNWNVTQASVAGAAYGS